MSGDAFRPHDGHAIAVLGAGEAGAHAHADCFADEVVIDFPSVAVAVEKMRSAFVAAGDSATALCARITLTTRQATDGVRVPFDVPLRSTCRTCGGRGETWSERCDPCDGSGTELLPRHVHVTVPAGVADGARFRFTVASRQDPPTHIEIHVAVRS